MQHRSSNSCHDWRLSANPENVLSELKTNSTTRVLVISDREIVVMRLDYGCAGRGFSWSIVGLGILRRKAEQADGSVLRKLCSS